MAQPPIPTAVLDTNIVLAWLVFHDPACQPLTDAIARSELRWLASAGMRSELEHVLSRQAFLRHTPDMHHLARCWDRWTHPVELPALNGAATRLRCTDPDDQVFIDVALGHGCRWLISRDRAVLKLAKRARPLGLEIVPPQCWIASTAGSIPADTQATSP